MTSRIGCGLTILLSVMTALLGAQATNSSNVRVLPSDDDIRQILRQRVDAQGKGIGIVVGVIGPVRREGLFRTARSVKETRARSMATPLSRLAR